MMSCNPEIIKTIREKNKFLILGHVDPDGDSLGSMLALSLFLTEQIEKTVFMHAPSSWPLRYGFLEKHRNGTGTPPFGEVDCIFILDCSSPERIDWGGLNPDDFSEIKKIVIDHHAEGYPFGAINWIDKKAAAVGEMIYDILVEFGAEITPGIAESLFCAITTDTGRFTFNNTTARSLQICSELVSRGFVNPSFIASQIYFNYSEEYLRNIGIALYNSRTYYNSCIVLLTLDRASVRSFSTTFDESEGIVDLAMCVRNAEVAALFKEIGKNNIRVSLRSKGLIDVGALASELGGGGHFNAAGCTLQMPLSLAREVILDRFETALDKARKIDE